MFSLLSKLAYALLLSLPLLAFAQSGSDTNSNASVMAATPTWAQLKKMIDRGQAAEALVALDRLAATKPVPMGVDRLRGSALYAQSNYQAADQAFADALVQDPQDREALQMRGLTLFRLGKATEAIPLLEAARGESAQSKADPNYVLALCYLETHRYDDARHAFAAQYGFPQDSAAAYLLAARMLFRREYVPIAQEYAHKAAELDPNLPLAHLLSGEIALAGQHVDEAITEFKQEQARDPLEPGIYDRLGDAYLRAGRYAESEQVLQEAVLLEPNSTGPYILLGKVLLKRDDPASAAGYLERAQMMDPGNYITHGLLGQAYRAMGRTQDASQEMQKAESLQAATASRASSAQTKNN